jgi:hypothetical protein
VAGHRTRTRPCRRPGLQSGAPQKWQSRSTVWRIIAPRNAVSPRLDCASRENPSRGSGSVSLLIAWERTTGCLRHIDAKRAAVNAIAMSH